MGADADIFLFDYEAYVREVVPTFRRLLRTGEVDAWVRELLARHPGIDIEIGKIYPSYQADLLRHCTYLAPDLACDSNARSLSLHCSYTERACPSDSCPERFTCPFHRNQSGSIELNELIQVAVAAKCLAQGQHQFLGRSLDILQYESVLSEQGIGATDPIWDLLYRLARRGLLVGCRWMNSDGIHGWLDKVETRDLFQRLDALVLPRFKTTFEAMRTIHRQYLSQESAEWWLSEQDRVEGSKYAPLSVSFPTLTLAFLRTTAQIASESSMGLLWANDLLFPEDYIDWNSV